MGISFNESKGAAQKTSIEAIEYKLGENKLRICGEILPRYVYWVKGENGKNIPFECLSFDRASESFNNLEKDWVKEFYPDLKCSWAYATQGFEEDKIKVVNLKKKLWEAVRTTAKDLGDPTDPETGWDIVFEKKKTGSQVYNVEYQLRPLACKKRPLTEREMELYADMKSVDDVISRPTPDAQKALLDRIHGVKAENQDDESIEDEFKVG
jgi:hypothetical protein